MAPLLTYFSLRGRGEPIRLTLSLINDGTDAWEESSVDYSHLKASAGTAESPFGQAPLYTDGELVVAQMDAILRHLARKHSLYGKTEVEHTVIDMMLSGAEDIREKYLLVCYQHQFDAESVSGFRNKHLMHGAHINETNGGAHLYYLEQLVGRDEQFSETGFAVGGCASIADAQLYDLVDIILIRDVMKCKDLQKDYPNLMKVYKTFSALSGVQKYLQSDRRHTKVNGNGLG